MRYWPGLSDAVAKVEKMTDVQLLAHIDGLFGRDNLKFGDGHQQILEEAIRQTRKDFEKKDSE